MSCRYRLTNFTSHFDGKESQNVIIHGRDFMQGANPGEMFAASGEPSKKSRKGGSRVGQLTSACSLSNRSNRRFYSYSHSEYEVCTRCESHCR